MAKQQHKPKYNPELQEKIDNGISRCVNMQGVDYYLDVMNDNGKRQLKRYLNFV